MPGRYRLAAASLALGLIAAPAAEAADLDGIYAPPPAYAAPSYCPPFGTPKVYYEKRWWMRSKGPRLVYLNPPPEAYPIYVTPQQAYIVSDPCPNEYRQNWYEGKLFYYNGGSPQRPDTFIIDQRY
jgi:hypothetical protein